MITAVPPSTHHDGASNFARVNPDSSLYLTSRRLLRQQKTSAKRWAVMETRQPRAAVARVEVGEEVEELRLRGVLVDQDRGAGPGVAQVAGVGLAGAELGLVDPRAGVPVAGLRAVGGAHVGERLVGVSKDDLLRLGVPA